MLNRDHVSPLRLLIACEDATYAAALNRFLEVDGHEIDLCHDGKGVLRLASRNDYDVIVLDLKLEAAGDIDLISFARRQNPSTNIILLFEITQIDMALDGIRRGAYFYLPRTCQPSDVAMVVTMAQQKIARDGHLHAYEQSLFEEMAGNTPAMKRVIELIGKVAPTDSTVLLLGESGTGKEVVANAIHRLSNRRDMPFVAINCAALPENLLESEMFGHVKGAFTGAEQDKRGLFEEADGGTLFLDEVADMSLITQAKLLRVLQNGDIRRVGSSVTQRVDVRVIAATNRDLVEAVASNSFREDLYFRLNIVQIRIPPLRERPDALPMLFNHFLTRYNHEYGKSVRNIDEQAESLLRSYPFPGNVRELESTVAHAVIMCDGDTIRARDLPDQILEGGRSRLALPNYVEDEGIPTLQEMEERHIRRALDALDGNQTEAAKALGISRSTLWRKMKEYDLSK